MKLGEQSPGVGETHGNHIKHGRLVVFGKILGESRYRKPWLSPDVTRVRHHLALDNFEQGRFAGAIAPNQTNPLAGIDLKSRALE